MKPISAKTIEPATGRLLSLPTLRAQCEIVTIDADSDGLTSHPDDALLLGYLDASTDHAEKFTGRALLLRTFEFALDQFPHRTRAASWEPWGRLQPGIEIPYPPLVEILSLTFTDDSDGELDAGTDYTVDDYGDKAVLRPVDTWPTMTAEANRVRVRYRAGYQGEEEPDTDAEPLPGAIRAAVLLMVQDLHQNRGTVSEDCIRGVEALLRPWRVLLGMA
jgi:uncharacterized phiE125 gp8 family phage protein